MPLAGFSFFKFALSIYNKNKKSIRIDPAGRKRRPGSTSSRDFPGQGGFRNHSLLHMKEIAPPEAQNQTMPERPDV